MNDSQVKAGPDWLRELTLTLKNVSGKAIKVCVIRVIIEQSGTMSAKAAMLMGFPSENVLDPEAKLPDQQLLLWKPSQVIRVKIPSNQLRLLDDLRDQGVSDIDNVSLAIDHVNFEDGTGWLQGLKTHENPNIPGSMIPDGPSARTH